MATDYVADNLEAPVFDHLFPNMIEADKSASTWPYFRKQIDHPFRVDRRNPTVGFINRDEASILYANASAFKGRSAIEIGAWRGWSTAYLVAAGVAPLHVVEPLLADADWRREFEAVVRGAGGAPRPSSCRRRAPRRSFASARPERGGRSRSSTATTTARRRGTTRSLARAISKQPQWSCFMTLCRRMWRQGCARSRRVGFSVMAYQTAQMMGVAWRGAVAPVAHKPDPAQHWRVPDHLTGIRISGEAAA